MPRVIVAIWSVNTLRHSWFRLANDVKLNLTERAVRKLHQDTRFQALVTGGAAMAGIFVAPEYLFADMTSNEGKQIEDLDRWLISTTLTRLSNDYRRMLVLPGTIAYRHQVRTRLDAREALDLMRQQLTTLQAPTMSWHVARTWRGARIDRWKVQHEEEVTGHRQKIERFEKAIVGLRRKTIYAARNTAFGLFDGQLVMTYHKRGEVGEVTGQDAPVFFVNGNRPGACTVGGVRFGLEVCKDANDGYLSGTGLPGLDVHVVLSASVETRDIRKAPGTVLIHACQIQAQSDISRRDDVAVAAYANHRVGGWRLDLYQVDI